MKKALLPVFLILLLFTTTYGQNATSTIPISIGMPCGSNGGIGDSIMYFNYYRGTESINRLSTCRPNLAAPGIYAYNTSVSFNPADGYLYFVRYNSDGSYIWRWDPATCPGDVPVYQFYSHQSILGLDFDATGTGYQIIFTGSSAPYGLALQKVDFSTGTFGPIVNIDLQGKKINTQNGDMVITTNGQFLMVWDNLYFSLNYQDYNTATPLKATYISNITLPGSTKLVGLAYAQGKLVGSASSCGYYDFNILSGKLTDLTEGPGLQYSTDMTNITSGVGAAKKLVSATPVSSGVYDLVYDVTVQNYGDYPISNLQITEDLTTMHPLGAGAISNVSTEWVSNPAGISRNTNFDGVTDKRLIAATPSQILPVFPRANSSFVIRIKFRFSSVVAGVVYNNNVKVTGRGYNNVFLTDSSTNGTNPDLNNNFKPDDEGENQPTPFSVSVASETPPCSSINTILYSQGFGSGTTNTTSMPGTATTEYTGSTTTLDEEKYMLTSNANNGNASQYISLADHTGNTNGKMLLVNADVNNYKLFSDLVNVTCANVKYSLIVYAANVMNDTYNTFCDAFGGTKKPSLTLIVRDAATNNIIANASTGDITNRSWTQYGMKWVMPAGVSSIRIEIYNTGEGGCGNAVAIDDIQFGICDPTPSVAPTIASAGCAGSGTTFSTDLSDTTGMSSTLQYQWQLYNNVLASWVDIAGANTTKYTVPYDTSNHTYYRIIVGADGNVGNSACQFISNTIKPQIKDTTAVPASIKSSKAFACTTETLTLRVQGGSLGSNATWQWYQASCDGNFLGTGDSIHVTLEQNSTFTKFFVKGAGDCNITQCVNIEIPQSCILASETVDLRATLEDRFSSLAIKIVSDAKIESIELERSFDGAVFGSVWRKDINGFADNNGYSCKDDIGYLNESAFYYRVKVNTAAGSAYYSKIIKLSRSARDVKVAAVFPNPVHTSAKLVFNETNASKVEIKLYNMQGSLVRTYRTVATAGTNTFNMNDLGNLPAGLYSMSVADETKSQHLQVLIQR